MDLLEKSSILLTPTAYNNGEALCVKPSDGSGDFDFSRNSAATRVNAQGLVENVQILSSNLVQNGNFSEEGAEEVSNGSFSQEGAQLVTNGDFATDSDWSLNGWNISGGTANNDGVNTGNINQNIGLQQNKFYKISITITNYVSGALKVRLGTGTQIEVGSANGEYTLYLENTTTNPNIRFYPDATLNFNGSIDNVSVREVGQDWTLQSEWSIGTNKAIYDNSSSGNLVQSFTWQVGKVYKITFDIGDFTTNQRFDIYSGVSFIKTATTENNTSYEIYFKGDGGSTLRFRGLTTESFSITNISVKEVGMDWSITGTGWNISDNGLSGLAAEENVTQPISTIVGKKYVIKFTISNWVSGDVYVRPNNSGGTQFYVNGNGTYTEEFTGVSNSLVIRARPSIPFTGTISNISLIEITTDTNLPRINYEGFSYQDALGSEEIVNGSFDTDSDWTKGSGVTISNGKALVTVINGGYQSLGQSLTYISGKSYTLTASVNGTAGKGCTFFDASGNNGGLNTSNGGVIFNGEEQSVKFEFTANSNSNIILIARNGAGDYNFSIDNVSVKEYLGQEVVPNSGCGSWLFEPQSTNLLPYSEEITQFDQNNVTTLNNQTISADGTQNASKVTKLGASANDRIKEDISISSATSYNVSVFLKNDTIDGTTSLGIRISGGTLFRLGFDWSGSTPSISASYSSGTRTNEIIENYGNGWYRVGFSFVSDGTNADFELDLDRGNGGDTTSLFVWGAQLEQQSYATSYIPTSGSTVTRNQDVCTNGGSLATINSTEGTLYGEFSSIASDNNSNWINISDGTATNWLFVGRDFNKVRIYLRANNAVVVSDTTTPLANNNKVALSYKSGDIRAYINGVEVVNLTSAFSFTSALNTLDFNAYNGGGTTTQIAWKSVAVWKEALSDQELTELTTI